MNLSFCGHFKRVVEIMIARQQMVPSTRSKAGRVERFLDPDQKDVPRRYALAFALFSVGISACTYGAIVASRTVCWAYPECVVYAFRWRTHRLCPCLTLADAFRAPKIYDE